MANYYITATEQMNDLATEREKTINNAANIISQVSLKIGGNVSSVKEVEKELDTLLNKFNTEDKKDILLKALAKIAINY